MNSERIREILTKIPISAIVVVFVLWIGWDYYGFLDGELKAKQEEHTKAEQATDLLAKKVDEQKRFFQTLEQKRAELRGLAQQLEQMKARLSDQIDVPAFIKLVSNEAARVGLRVIGIRPGEPKAQADNYFIEQPFELEFRSVYPQLLIYLNRLASLETIVRVDRFNVATVGSPTAQYVELSGKIELKAYRYVTSKADEVGKVPSATPPGQVSPAQTPPQRGAGSPR
jgi:Tfp pilus assembly protein PilO